MINSTKLKETHEETVSMTEYTVKVQITNRFVVEAKSEDDAEEIVRGFDLYKLCQDADISIADVQTKYPFNEGDDYWTIEENETTGELEVVWSCWDDQSELFHDENPNKSYYKTCADAVTALEEGKEKTYPNPWSFLNCPRGGQTRTE